MPSTSERSDPDMIIVQSTGRHGPELVDGIPRNRWSAWDGLCRILDGLQFQAILNTEDAVKAAHACRLLGEEVSHIASSNTRCELLNKCSQFADGLSKNLLKVTKLARLSNRSRKGSACTVTMGAAARDSSGLAETARRN
jgi:hypothetical protein